MVINYQRQSINLKEISPKKSKNYINSLTFLLIAFATAFFPRLLSTIGAPSAINFLHFGTIPLACGIALIKTKTKDRRQIALSKELLFALFVFLTVSFASALLNGVGTINVILSYLLWAEPFLLLVAIICLPLSLDRLHQFRFWIVAFNIFHLLLAFVQKLAIGHSDYVQGVFYFSGSGHVVGSSVSLSFSLYYFTSAKICPLWIRYSIIAASFIHLVAADAKQVLLTFIIAFALLSLTKFKDFSRIIIYAIGLGLFIVAFSWAIYNIPALGAFTTWLRPEIYGPDGEATLLKFSGIRIVISHYHSTLNWWLGLGPGHTIDRLGGWMLKGYSSILMPLGATISSIGDEVWTATGKSWLGEESSFFSPFWGWAALWGDLGFVGLASYLYLCTIIWQKLCVNDFSKVLMLTVLVHGLIFTQMQEPGYMLFIATIIGLQWQEYQSKSQEEQYKNYLQRFSVN